MWRLPGAKALLCGQLGFRETWEANLMDKGRHAVFTQPPSALSDMDLRRRLKSSFWAVSNVLRRTAVPSYEAFFDEGAKAAVAHQGGDGDLGGGTARSGYDQNPPTSRAPFGARVGDHLW